ncbi:MAG: hypothetical protein SXG53_26635 [Pseudomonadota bacterium]|nr:hypothetical protein [Pseudomonadota bacterium]
MTTTPRKYVCVIRTPLLAAWSAYDEDDQLWHVEAFVRGRLGVQYLETDYSGDQPLEEVMIRDAFHFGHFSPRPCSLDREFDPSMTHGVLAHLRHWCRTHSVDLDRLMKEAYPDSAHRTEEDFEQIVAQAEWEGIEYPEPDDRYQTRRLLLALRNVGYDEIAEVFVRVIRQLP